MKENPAAFAILNHSFKTITREQTIKPSLQTGNTIEKYNKQPNQQSYKNFPFYFLSFFDLLN
jgi:hypothetical protein